MRIEESAARKQARIDSGQDTIVGVNKYRLAKEDPINVLQIDNSSVRQKQIDQLKKIRATRNETKVKEILGKLQHSADLQESTGKGSNEHNLLRLAIEAARARATLGEISEALREKWGDHKPTEGVVQGAYSAAFAQAADLEQEFKDTVAMISKFADDEGRRPRILVAKMGQDGHDRGAKVIASGFADIGFDVDVGPLFQTPDEVAMQAIDADVHVIGVSSQAAGHKTLVPQLLEALKKKGASHIRVVVGGVIPPQDYDFLFKAGAAAVFGPGTRIPLAAREVVKLIKTK
jgi:methylmalonyl-CoA mutase